MGFALPAAGEKGTLGLCTGTEPRPCRGGTLFQSGGPLLLDLTLREEPDNGEAPPPGGRPSPAVIRRRSVGIAAGSVILTPVAGWLTWWSIEEKVRFNFANEGWFDPDTYAGGADKANHMVAGYIGQQVFDRAFRAAGQPPGKARWWAFATVQATGLAIEAGDGFTRYGASWEDAASNVVGAGVALFVSAGGLDDTVGLRMGQVPYEIPPPCCRATGYGSDYSKWIHSADLKLGGFLPRVGVDPGPARFFLISMTYGSKGYRFSPVESRQRNLGVELGLNIPEILRAIGVSGGTWWGKPLLAFFTYVRVPWTSFGWHYDFNGRRWHGPDTGDDYAPGLVIYDRTGRPR